MSWGQARRPKISTKLGRPLNREGSEGDTQIKGTPLGAKLFAKWSGRWWDVPLSINGVTKFGESISNYLSIDTDSIDIIKGSKNVASFGASMRVGEDSTSKSALRVASDGSMTIGVKDATAQFAVDSDGNCTFGGELSTAIDLSGLTEASIAAGDYFIFFDGGITGATRKDSINDLVAAMDGTGLTASGITLNLTNTAVTVTSGTGMTGGGSVALGSSTTLNVIGGTGITANANDIALTNTAVTVVAGAGMTGGGSVALGSSTTLNVIAGTGIDVAADAVSVDVSDFMSNGANNYVVTATGTDAMNAESGLTFSGTALTLVDDGTMQSSSFASGFTGHGWRINDTSGTAQGAAASGNASATFDSLSVRGTMSVYEMLIQQIRATNGSLIVSSAAKVESVANYSSGTDEVGDITFESTVSGTLTCPFVVNDIIMSQRVDVNSFVPGDETYNGSNIVTKKVLKVTAVSQNVVTTGDVGFASGTAPVVGDDFVRIGNTGTSDANVARQGILYLTSDDEDAPFIDVKSGVNTYAKWDAATSTKVRVGKLKGITGVEEEYGLWAGVSGTQYLKATSVGLEIHSTAALYTAYTGSEINFHDGSAAPKMTIGAGNITIFKDDSTNVAAQWNDDVITLGDQANTKIVITGSGGSAGVTIGSKISLSSTGVATVADILLTGKIVITASGVVDDTDNVCIGSNNSDLGEGNIFLGRSAGAAGLSGGDRNVGIGLKALESITTGDYNICIGDRTGYELTIAQGNVIIGYVAGLYLGSAGESYPESYNNTYVGGGAGRGTDGANKGYENTAVGESALLNISAGHGNVAVGRFTGYRVTDGNDNTMVGGDIAQFLTTGDNNLLLGHDAGQTGSPGGSITTADNTLVLGDENIAASHIQTDFTVASDKRDKTDVSNLSLGLEFINKLTPVTYKWDKRSKYIDKKADPPIDLNTIISDGTHTEDCLDVGFLAQDVEAIENSYGHNISDKTNLTFSISSDGKQYGTQYTKFVPILTKAVQELSTKLDTMQTEINNLKAE